MALFAKTELDVLRESARKAMLVPIDDPFESFDQASIAESTASRRDTVKLAIRIWTSVCKFIRSQCIKGRVIDTQFFGTFAKASSIGITGPEADSHYVFSAGPNSPFTMQENRDNVADISQAVLDEKLVQLNFSSIAAVSRCTPDSVKSLLTQMKADLVDFVLVRNIQLNLNVMVGQLNFATNGSVDFKSAPAIDTVSTFSSMLPSELRSKAGDSTDRGLRAMQDAQSVGMHQNNHVNSSASKRKMASVFSNTQRTWAKQPLNDMHTGTGEEYGHLTQFLQDQIVSRKQRSNAGGSRGSRRSVGNNAIIEQAAKVKDDASAMQDLVNTNKAGSECEKVTKKDWQTMHMTHIHKPMYASPGMGHMRHKTMSQSNRTPNIGPRTMPGTMDVDLDFNNEGITNDRALYRHSDTKLNNIISRSLNRKNVSYAYHTGYPIMMNAQGPYAVYSHMKRQGEHAYQGERKTRKAAYNRFEDDLRNLQSEREQQRDQFFGNIKEEQMLEQAKRQFQIQNNKANQEYILNQIAADRETRRKMRVEEIAYKKPHFGPEETHDVIEDLTYEDRLKKHTVLNNLQAQIKHREEQRKANEAAEKQCDRENLDRFMAEQNAEMQAQREKIMNDKRKLKKAWEKQAAMRNDNEARDNLFK